jgi:2,4-dienoyl-CoA reductase-like NADH-dependent reductase (Old Yellow Enzyme family)
MTNAPIHTDPLFQPLTIRGLTLKNRIMSSAHACGTDDGGLTGLRFQRYHEEKAKGGLGLTMFGGSSNVAPDSPDVFRQLNMGTDAAIPHLQELSERIHRHGCAVMCQIIPTCIDQNPYAHLRMPMDMIFHGCLMSLFQASQQSATMSS